MNEALLQLQAKTVAHSTLLACIPPSTQGVTSNLPLLETAVENEEQSYSTYHVIAALGAMYLQEQIKIIQLNGTKGLFSTTGS